MTDRQFLVWIYDRLVYVHKERELTDYMHKLRKIIMGMDPAKTAPNVADVNTMPDEWRKRVG